MRQVLYRAAAACMAVGLVCSAASADTHTWIGSATGSNQASDPLDPSTLWSNAANWTGGMPSSTDTAVLALSTSGLVNVTGSAAIGLLYVDGSSANGALSILDGGSLRVSGTLHIGSTSFGRITQTSGTVACVGRLYLGYGTNSTGSYDLSGGLLSVGGDEYAGYRGTGIFVQSAGTHITQRLFLGYSVGAYGSYKLSDGWVSAVSERIGYNGTGVFTQSGGVNACDSLDIYRGTYALSGGTLEAGAINLYSGLVEIGGTAMVSGLFYVSSGTTRISGWLEADRIGGMGVVVFEGGTISLSGSSGMSTGGLFVTGTGVETPVLHVANSITLAGTVTLNRDLIIETGAGAILTVRDLPAGSGGITLAAGGLALSGNLKGSLVSGSGATLLTPGYTGMCDWFRAGGLTTATGMTTLLFDIGTTSGECDFILIGTGGMNLARHTMIALGTNPSLPGIYSLIGGQIGTPDLSLLDLPQATLPMQYQLSSTAVPGWISLVVADRPVTHAWQGAATVGNNGSDPFDATTLWTNPSNWSAGIPTGSDIVGIALSTSGLVNVTSDTYAGAIYIDGPSANGALCIRENGSLGSGSDLRIGQTSFGRVLQLGGTAEIVRDLTLGVGAAAAGIYELSDGELRIGRELVVGVGGSGRFVQSGGTVICSGTMAIASGTGSSGVYELGGGLLQVAGYEIINGPGIGGAGLFIQTGGTNACGFLYGFSYGQYELRDGVLLAGSALISLMQTGGTSVVAGYADLYGTLSSGYMTSGRASFWSFTQSGGTAVIAGQAAFDGTSSFVGGYFSSGSASTQGNRVQTGGTAIIAGGYGIVGTYSLSDGYLSSGAIIVTGGRFLQSGGTAVILGQLNVSGTYNLSDGYLSSGAITVTGGRFLQSGGTAVILGQLNVSGTYSLSGGCLSSGAITVTGGRFLQSGGTVVVAGSLFVSGTYLLNGGYLSAGRITGSGRFIYNGGIFVPSGTVSVGTFNVGWSAGSSASVTLGSWLGQTTLHLGGTGGYGAAVQSSGLQALAGLYIGLERGSRGRYDLAGGTLVTTTVYIGYSGTGLFTQSSGSNSIEVLYMGYSSSGGYGSYELSDGWVSAVSERIGYNGTGVFTQSGGTNFATRLSLDFGRYELSGGMLVAGTEIIGEIDKAAFVQTGGINTCTFVNVYAGRYDLSNGYLAAGSAYIQGPFSQTGGTAAITNLLTIWGTYGLSAGYLTSGSAQVGARLLQSGGTVAIAGTLSVTGTYSLSNGWLAARSADISGRLLQSGGTAAVTRALSVAGAYYLSNGWLASGSASINGGLFHSGGTATVGGMLTVNGTYCLTGGHLSVGFIGGSGTLVYDGGTLSVSGSSSLGFLGVGLSPASNRLLVLDSWNQFAVGSFLVGGTGGTGTIKQFGGNCVSQSYLGYTVGGRGTFELISGMLTATNQYVGYAGTGLFTQTSGTHAVQNLLCLGYTNGAHGSYSLSSGMLISGSELIGCVSYAGTGALAQSGGTNTCTSLTLSPRGRYDLVDGFLYTDVATVNGMMVQSGGTAKLTWLSGSGSYTHAGGYLTAGSASIAGQFVHSAGTTFITGDMRVDGTCRLAGGYLAAASMVGLGTLVYDAQTIIQVGVISVSSLCVGWSPNSSASLIFDLPAQLWPKYLYLGGTGGFGSVRQTEGSYLPARITIGANYGGRGLYELAGGELAPANEYVGATGTGMFIQSAGTHQVSTIVIGDNSYGEYLLTGGVLTASWQERIGQSFSAMFRHSGGTNTAGQLLLGYYATYELSGGALLAGSASLAGRYVQTGGTAIVTENVLVSGTLWLRGGYFGAASLGGTGALIYDGGSFDIGESFSVSRLHVGWALGSSANVAISATSQFSPGIVFVGGTGGRGAVTQLCGAVSSTSEYIGYSGTGMFTQVNGTHIVGDKLFIGYGNGANGSYDLSGGTLTASAVYVGWAGGGGAYIQSGGTAAISGGLYVGGTCRIAGGWLSADLIDGYGRVVLEGGILELTGSGSTFAPRLTVTAGGASTPELRIANTMTLNSWLTLDRELLVDTGTSGYLALTGTVAGSAGLALDSGSLALAGTLGGPVVLGAGVTSLVVGRTGSVASLSIGGLTAAAGLTMFFDVSAAGTSDLLVLGTHGINLASHNSIALGFHPIVPDIFPLIGGQIDTLDLSLFDLPAATTPGMCYMLSATAMPGFVSLVADYMPLQPWLGAAMGGNTGVDPSDPTTLWNEAGNWSGGAVPGTATVVGLAISCSGLVNITDAGAAAVLQIDGPSMDGAMCIRPPGNLNIAVNLCVGITEVGRLLQIGGTVQVSGVMQLGRDLGSYGRYELSGGSLGVVGSACIGLGGTGVMVHSGGTHNAASLGIGTGTGGSGRYELSGGALVVAGTECIGSAGTGVFIQTGGSHTATNTVLGSLAGGDGSYVMSSGSATFGSLVMGGSGHGKFTLDADAQVRVGQLTLGNQVGGTGEFILDGGVLTSSGNRVGYYGCGVFTQISGTHVQNGYLDLAARAGSVGVYRLEGGWYYVPSSCIQWVGNSGSASFIQTGGMHLVGTSLYIGSSQPGYYRLEGGELNVGGKIQFNTNSSLLEITGGTLTATGIIGSAARVLQTGGTACFSGTLAMGVGDYQMSDGYLSADSCLVNQFQYDGGTVSIAGTFTCDSLLLGLTPGSGVQWDLPGSGATGTRICVVGGSGSAALRQASGTQRFASLTLGQNVGGAGRYEVNGGTLATTGDMYVGQAGTGVLMQTAGTHIASQLYLGYQANAFGAFAMSGGQACASDLYVGWSGTGVVSQTGGSVEVGSTLLLGCLPSAGGSYLIANGRLIVAENEHIGYSGLGAFTQSGGTNVCGGILVVGRGVYDMGGGTLVCGSTYVTATGAFTQTAGTSVLGSALQIDIGGTCIISGGYFSVGGISGSGEFVHDGGAACISGTVAVASLQTGKSASADVGWDMGATMVAVPMWTVGGAGRASVAQTSQIAVCGTLLFGQQATGQGSYRLANGALTVTYDESVGLSGTGLFTQIGGAHWVGGSLGLASGTGSYGRYDLSGGMLSSSSTLYVGKSGIGVMVQSSGTCSSGVSIVLGSAAGAQGRYEMSGGGVSVKGLDVGANGTGVFVQSGGTNLISGVMYVGRSASGYGRYEISGGIVTASSVNVGYGGNGVFAQTGGTHVVSSKLAMGTLPGKYGGYELSGGSLSVAGTTAVGVGGLGSFVQTGGTSSLGMVSISGSSTSALAGGWMRTTGVGGGRLFLSGGVLEMAGSSTIATSSVTVLAGTAGAPVLRVAPGGTCTLAAPVTMSGPLVIQTGAGQFALATSSNGKPKVRIDIGDSPLVFDYSGGTVMPQVEAWVRGAMTATGWAGSGIGSTMIDDPTTCAIACIDNAAFLGGPLTDFWGVPVDATSVLVRKVIAGDVDGSGEVNAADYFFIDFNLGASGGGWACGDLDYSGETNAADYFFIDFNLGSGGAATGGPSDMPLGVFGGMHQDATAPSVPEPATVTLLLLGLGVISRRRNSNVLS
jgi:hypothetical protein